MAKAFAVRLTSERRGRNRRHGKDRPRRSGIVGLACHRYSDRPICIEGQDELRQAWVDWIRVNDPFDWFVTFTFKEDVSVELAVGLLDRWLARLAQACRDKSGHAASLTCVCAIEWTTNHRVHLHLVVKALSLRDHRRLRWCMSRRPSRRSPMLLLHSAGSSEPCE